MIVIERNLLATFMYVKADVQMRLQISLLSVVNVRWPQLECSSEQSLGQIY